jgi:uncharacterized protein involved in exopolysaccharide biosynthesis
LKKEIPFQSFLETEEDNFDLIEVLLKYLRYWPWFLLALILGVFSGYLFMRYAPVIYYSEAKIKILKESEENVLELAGGSFYRGSGVNLSNEIQVLKSYRLLKQVVEELNLDIGYYEVGNIKTRQIWRGPFTVEKNSLFTDSTRYRTFGINVGNTGFIITYGEANEVTIPFGTPDSLQTTLPFTIHLSEDDVKIDPQRNDYRIVFMDPRQATLQLSNQLQVWPTEESGEILSLALYSESPERSEIILNTIIEKFNQDGILDRQEVSQRTIDFIDDRFVYLTQELDSIETRKQSFKQANELAYIEADAGLALQRKSGAEVEVYRMETQLSLARMLQEKVESQTIDSLLPAEVGLENETLNTLIAGYNELVFERERLTPNMGEKNPTLQMLTTQLERRRDNILNSLQIYKVQLETSLEDLKERQEDISGVYSQLPEEERMLRAIERQQQLKENLFIVLLQQREEAAVALAVTSPTIKTIDYALTRSAPESPKRNIVYGAGVLLGLFIPFGILFLKFSLDTKIHTRKDLEKELPELPILTEIPFIPPENMKKKDRSFLSESFRILGTNVRFVLGKKNTPGGKVGIITSSIKGEGKTLIATELAHAYSSLNQRVLLVGGDLRNPRFHDLFGGDKNDVGLSDYLSDPELSLDACVRNPEPESPTLSICFSGRIPPNQQHSLV